METLLQSILSVAEMKNFLPDNTRVGLKGGVFFGLFQHSVFPTAVGDVECTVYDDKTFGAKGKINEIRILRIPESPFDGKVTLTGPTSAKLEVTVPVEFEADLLTTPKTDRITYHYKDEDEGIEATVEQTFENQAWNRGSYVEFWVKHNIPRRPNFNVRFWWERT